MNGLVRGRKRAALTTTTKHCHVMQVKTGLPGVTCARLFFIFSSELTFPFTHLTFHAQTQAAFRSAKVLEVRLLKATLSSNRKVIDIYSTLEYFQPKYLVFLLGQFTSMK